MRPMLAVAQDFGFDGSRRTPPLPLCRPRCEISPSASCPFIGRIIPTATSGTSRRCKWWPAIRRRRMSRVWRCRSGDGASNVRRRVAPSSSTSTRRRERSRRPNTSCSRAHTAEHSGRRWTGSTTSKRTSWKTRSTHRSRRSRKALQHALDRTAREELRHARGSARARAGLVRLRGLSQFRRRRTIARRGREGKALLHRRGRDPRCKGRDGRGDVGPPAERHRREIADAARVHARSIEP